MRLVWLPVLPPCSSSTCFGPACTVPTIKASLPAPTSKSSEQSMWEGRGMVLGSKALKIRRFWPAAGSKCRLLHPAHHCTDVTTELSKLTEKRGSLTKKLSENRIQGQVMFSGRITGISRLYPKFRREKQGQSRHPKKSLGV